jgi:hypothetical protein
VTTWKDAHGATLHNFPARGEPHVRQDDHVDDRRRAVMEKVLFTDGDIVEAGEAAEEAADAA